MQGFLCSDDNVLIWGHRENSVNVWKHSHERDWPDVHFKWGDLWEMNCIAIQLFSKKLDSLDLICNCLFKIVGVYRQGVLYAYL